MDKKLEKVAQEAVKEAKAQGMDDEDATWMATGAVIREGRNQGVIGENLTPEMTDAAKALVEKEMKKCQ